MCGFVYSNQNIHEINLDDLETRGPDDNDSFYNELGFFYHCRLSTRKTNIKQPAKNKFGILLYNGTEYSKKENDVGFILDNLNDNINDNIEFIKTLGGDFSICWVTENYILIAKDCFGTKPLFWSIDNNKFMCASTVQTLESSGFNTYKLLANSIMIFSRKDCKFVQKCEIVEWDLHQGKTNLYNIFDAFEESVLNQFDKNCMLHLSSGFDSGGIACCLNKYNKNYTALTFIGTENKEILKARYQLHTGKKIFITPKDFENNDNIKNKIYWHNFLMKDSIIYDISLVAAQLASKNKIKIILTGSGSDELFSDYGTNNKKLKPHSQFGGKFPEELQTIFPWHLNEDYPMSYDVPIVDYIDGLYGIDTRHPYLDRKLFQTWLNSDLKIKNASYKNWLGEYFKLNKYPYAPNQKIGAHNPVVYID